MPTTAPNHWFDDRCARAFWDQQQALPYRELLRDTVEAAAPLAGEHWLDLGCGGGPLTAALWSQSGGNLAGILAIDCAAANAGAIADLCGRLNPQPGAGIINFQQGDLSRGLPGIDSDHYDGVISGLALSYAESWDEEQGCYTTAGYERILAEVFRVLRPGGRLVYSVNVPEPNFWRIFWRSLRRGFRVAHLRRVLVNTWRMQRYGSWLKQQARLGRFHFLPWEHVRRLVEQAGFTQVTCQLSYARQAYVIRGNKPQQLRVAG